MPVPVSFYQYLSDKALDLVRNSQTMTYTDLVRDVASQFGPSYEYAHGGALAQAVKTARDYWEDQGDSLRSEAMRRAFVKS